MGRLEQEVGVPGEIREDARGRGMAEGERHALLAGVGRVPVQAVLAPVGSSVAGSEAPRRVTAGRLDLDHLDAEVDQDAPAEMAERVGQVECAQAVERRRHGAGV